MDDPFRMQFTRISHANPVSSYGRYLLGSVCNALYLTIPVDENCGRLISHGRCFDFSMSLVNEAALLCLLAQGLMLQASNFLRC